MVSTPLTFCNSSPSSPAQDAGNGFLTSKLFILLGVATTLYPPLLDGKIAYNISFAFGFSQGTEK